jgi:hypothetical protein
MAAYTWVGTTTDYNTGSNWTGGALPNVVPSANDTIVFSNNKPCDTGSSNRTCAGVSFIGYASVLTLTSNLICNGNLVMQSDQSIRTNGTGALIIGGLTSTITPNGGNWGSKLQIGNTGTTQVTLASGFNVTGTLTFTSIVNLIGNVNLSALGNVVATPLCKVTTSNTQATTLIFKGVDGGTTSWSGSGWLGCNITFTNSLANFSILSDVFFGAIPSALVQTPTLQYISSLSPITTTGSTLNIVGSVTLSVTGITLNNVNLTTQTSNSTYTINLNENLNIGGNFTQGVDGNGYHILGRSGNNQVVNLQGNLQIGTNTVSQNGLSASTTSGAKIVIIGKVGTPSVLGGSHGGFNLNFCNVDVDIIAGTNQVQLNTATDYQFNFGNGAVTVPAFSKTLKYVSGTLLTTGTTINFGQAIIDFAGGQTLNNVRLVGLSGAVSQFQLVNDLTLTGNLYQGSYYVGSGYGFTEIIQATGGVATSIFIQGGFQIGNYIDNGTRGAIKLKFVGSGTITGVGLCQNDIEFTASGSYVIGNFIYGRQTLPFTPTMKYVSGVVPTANGTLLSYTANYEIGNIALNNFQSVGITNFAPTITIKAFNIFRINGDFTTSIGTGSNCTINYDNASPNAQMDVYGNATIGQTTNASLLGSIKLYMKGTGTITCGGVTTRVLGVDTYIEGVNTTIGNVVFGNGKKFEYVSGFFTSTISSLIQILGTGTIKSNNQTFCDIAINSSSNLIVIGNLACRDLITYTGSLQTIGGSTYTISVNKNLTLGGTGGLLPLAANPISKIIMNGTNTGTGTWSGSQQLGIDLDLNGSGNTIAVTGQVGFYNSKTIKWYVGTTMSTSGSTLIVGSCTLDLGNQEWGSFISNLNSSVILTSNANFNGVTFGNGGGVAGTLSGNSPSLVLKVRSNFTNINASGTLQSAVGLNDVLLSMDGGGTFSSANATTNLNVQLTSGNTTLTGIVNWGGLKSFTRTGGVLVGGSSTFNVIGSNTISIPKVGGGTFWDVNMPPTATITLNAQMGILNNLVLSTTAANIVTFASSGTFGWDTKNFTHGGGTTTCILNAGSTYNVSGTFQLLGSNDTARATLRSSSLSSFSATANGTTLTISGGVSQSPIVAGMVVSQATGTAPALSFGQMLPNRPIVQSGSGINWLLDPAYPVPASTGLIPMESGLKAYFNLAPTTGVALVLFAITKDINSNGGQTIYAFQSYTDATSNPTANLFRTLNWNTLAPPVSPIGIGFISVT